MATLPQQDSTVATDLVPAVRSYSEASAEGCCNWEGVEVRPYKEDGTHFKGITRQTLFRGAHDLGIELRYFEVAPGGYSSLERHEHTHLAIVLSGEGEVMVGDKVYSLSGHDLVHIPPMTWHQFRAKSACPLGFLCTVAAVRDVPQRPNDEELAAFGSLDEVKDFFRV
jgi:quercetin dioxygenase-like cupin family protein